MQVPYSQGPARRNYLRSGSWKKSTRETAEVFSAVGYLTFAEVAQQLKIPVGVVEASRGMFYQI